MPTPADTLVAIGAPSSTNPGLPTADFPPLTQIQRTDLVGPVAANRQHAASEKRSIVLRDRVNQLIEVVNQLDSWFLRQNGSEQRNGVAGVSADMPMNNHSLTGLRAAVANGEAVRYDEFAAFTAGAATIPVGTMWLFAGAAAPTGWLLCNGNDYSTTGTYADLYSVIGFTYGSNGGNFRVPDFTRRFPVGANGPGGYTLAATGGEESHALTAAENGEHTHSMSGTAGSMAVNAGTGAYVNTTVVTTWTTSASGSGTPHENRPPYLAVNIIIKY